MWTDLVLYVSVETQSDVIKRKNLYLVNMFISFVSIIFNFTVIFFFWLMLKSVALVWIFLGIWNFVAFLVDIPVGALQKYLKAKTLLLMSSFFMLMSGLIFVYFLINAWKTGWSDDLIWMFISNPTNILLLLLSSIFYWFIQELNSVTILSYILNNADPSEYGSIMSRNNIFGWLGALIWLIISWIILAFPNKIFTLILFLFFVIILIIFVSKYFDNAFSSVDFSQISKLKIITQKEGIEKMKEYVSAQVKKTDFAEIAKKGSKYLFLKPMEVKWTVNFKELIETTKQEFKTAYSVIFWNPQKFVITWSIISIFLFWFWDTFAATFLVDFLKKFEINSGFIMVSAYILLWLIAIPAFVTPELFINIAKKIWGFPVVLFGILLSGTSMLFFWFSSSVVILIMFWVMNSLGYWAAMTLSQETFLSSYNNHCADKLWLKEIDSNASAAPLKMLQNIWNVIGLTTWGLLVTILGYTWFFIVFALALLWFFIFTIIRRKEIEF